MYHAVLRISIFESILLDKKAHSKVHLFLHVKILHLFGEFTMINCEKWQGFRVYIASFVLEHVPLYIFRQKRYLPPDD
jgi:hypothetical protein